MGNNNRKSSSSPSKKIKRSTPSHNHQEATDSKSGNVVLLDSNVTFLPGEKVFFIDHVMESIFLECDQRTLLCCRLVSRRSEYFATKALRKVVNIKFERKDGRKELVFSRASNFSPIYFPYFFYSGCRKRSIPALVDLLNNSPEFPCSSFSFYNDSVRPATPALEHFLNVHASRVEKVKLSGGFYPDNFEQLICALALNVKELLLSDVNVRTDNFNMFLDLDESEVPEDEDAQDRHLGLFNEDSFDDEEGPPQDQSPLMSTLAPPPPIPVLNSLKILQCENPIPETIIHHVLEACPNLVQVSLHHKNLHCLVEPRNFLHLLKKLVIDIDPDDDEDFDSLQLVANNHGNNLAVEEFEFFGFTDHDELQETLLDSVEKILQVSSATCTKLVLKTILENFKTPPQMPRVKHLTFPYQISYVTRQPRNIFPQGASLSETFPSLRSLHINSRHNMLKVPIGNIFGFGGGHHPSAPTVKDVELQFPKTDRNVVRNFQKMFPTATIRNTDKSEYKRLLCGTGRI